MNATAISEPNPRLDELLDKINGLAVLPHVVFKVLEISGSEDSSAHDMERAITVDPGFSSKILVLANSAAMALPRKVTSIREAISFLGFKQIRGLAMTIGAFDLFVGKTDKESLRRRAWWRHSVDTAVCCQWFARGTKKLPPDEAYTCGLLHYIGKTLLDRMGEGDYEHVQEMISFGIDETTAEREIFGCDHVQVATSACSKWGLPEGLVSGVNYRAEPDSDDPSRYHRACTAVSSGIARVAVAGWSGDKDDIFRHTPEWAFEVMGIPETHVEEIILCGTAAMTTANLQI